MANLNYDRRISNLRNRRFDKDLNESTLTKSFSTSDLPENIKYLVESMLPIGKKYNERTLQAAQNVQNHLERDFNLHFRRAYKNQGSVMAGTNIKVHSDIDLLTVIDRYHYPQGQPVNPYTESDPNSDIKDLRRQAVQILKRQYDLVDDKGEKSISIINQNLGRKVDIVPSFWYHSDKYTDTENEHYKGIYLFNFVSETKHLDYPFATVNNINHKGNSTNDGSRRGIRLLKTLKADCDDQLETLKSFQLTSIVHDIDSNRLYYNAGTELEIAKVVSSQINRIINEPSYRLSVSSPNGLEKPLTREGIVRDLTRLKIDLDLLIEDSSSEMNRSYSVQRGILTY